MSYEETRLNIIAQMAQQNVAVLVDNLAKANVEAAELRAELKKPQEPAEPDQKP